MTSIKEFCISAKILDLSPLGDEHLPLDQRLSLVWDVLKVKLTPEQQSTFVRFFGENCKDAKVNLLFNFVAMMLSDAATPTMKTMVRDNFIKQVMGMPAVVVEFGTSVEDFCKFPAQNFPAVATFIKNSDQGSIIAAIASVFPDETKDLQVVLERIVFKADPVKFVAAFDHTVESDTLQEDILRWSSEVDRQMREVARLKCNIDEAVRRSNTKRPADGSSGSGGAKRGKK
jgi:hypothetical protein